MAKLAEFGTTLHDPLLRMRPGGSQDLFLGAERKSNCGPRTPAEHRGVRPLTTAGDKELQHSDTVEGHELIKRAVKPNRSRPGCKAHEPPGSFTAVSVAAEYTV